VGTGIAVCCIVKADHPARGDGQPADRAVVRGQNNRVRERIIIGIAGGKSRAGEYVRGKTLANRAMNGRLTAGDGRGVIFMHRNAAGKIPGIQIMRAGQDGINLRWIGLCRIARKDPGLAKLLDKLGMGIGCPQLQPITAGKIGNAVGAGLAGGRVGNIKNIIARPAGKSVTPVAAR